MRFEEFSFEEAPRIITELSGPKSRKLLELQRKIDSLAPKWTRVGV